MIRYHAACVLHFWISLECVDELVTVSLGELRVLNSTDPWVNVEAGVLEDRGQEVGADAAVQASAVADELADAVSAGLRDPLKQVNVSEDTLQRRRMGVAVRAGWGRNIWTGTIVRLRTISHASAPHLVASCINLLHVAANGAGHDPRQTHNGFRLLVGAIQLTDVDLMRGDEANMR